ncbi:MAG: hypothetical protein KY475_05590, partial [Planctomycetes bacterium]|nr:hypothetical protein [Planctomycetota bacterium]
YAHVIHVAPREKHRTVAGALASVKDASPKNRYAILAAAGTYKESPIQMKQWVDLYGGFAPGDWKTRNVYQYAAILDAQKKGPVVIGADDARLDGFVITGGQQQAHGGGIVCDGVSPTIVNNIIVGNQTLAPEIEEGLGKQIANEGAGIALLSGSRAYVANNLICENGTEVGNGAGITARGNVQAKILRNVFCNNIAGVKDDQMFHGKVGSRSSPGGAIACSEESSPQISFNVIVMCSAPINNDAGGIWVEGNSTPLINYNWVVGNTSGDDGGGIYCMGNLYYTDAGERFDISPDASVPIEDNLIAGNNTVRGGPGGVRASRFGRIDLRRNIIVANEKGGAAAAEGAFICVMENNIIADNGAKRETATPSFRLTGDITAREFDERRYVTQIGTNKELGKEDLSGSVVRVGGQWSVVKSSSPGSLVVWGKIAEEAPKLEILDEYVAN